MKKYIKAFHRFLFVSRHVAIFDPNSSDDNGIPKPELSSKRVFKYHQKYENLNVTNNAMSNLRCQHVSRQSVDKEIMIFVSMCHRS